MTQSASKTNDDTAPRAPFSLGETPGAAIACNMEGAADTIEERFAEYGRLFAHALSDRARDGGAVVLTFTAKPGLADWLVDLVNREHACCAFLSYEIAFTADHVVLRVSTSAGPTAQKILDELYALPGEMGDGLDGHLARLANRGVSVARMGSKGFKINV